MIPHRSQPKCLQETFLKETDNISFKGYDTYSKTHQQQAIGQVVAPQYYFLKNNTPQGIRINHKPW